MHRIIVAGCTAAALVVSVDSVAAQGIALFGDARLGLGYNIDNEGDATGDDDLRAISRVRFGVNMTGETESGIVFGGEIHADEAEGGQGGEIGQTEGEVFVSGAFGTLSFGDTDAADLQHVGDLNEVGLTGLGDENETPFISDGGGFGDDGLHFAENPFARPTIRYDYDFAGFGISLSSNRDLDDIGVGASWTGEIAGGSLTVGGGYYDFSEFTSVSDGETFVLLDADGNEVEVQGAEVEAVVPPGEQWSAAVGGTFGEFNGKVIYTHADSDGESGFETLGAGFGAEFGAWEVNLYYNNIIDAFGTVADLDGDDSLGLGVNYDLGGAAVMFGIADTYADQSVADFGIDMAF